MRTQKSWGLVPAFLLSVLLSACGGGGNDVGFGGGDDGTGGGGVTPPPVVVTQTPAFVFLNSSGAQLPNDADQVSEGVTLTAIVTDASGNVVPNVAVAFSIAPGSGAIAPSSTVTDSAGSLSAVLTTGGNSTLRTVTVTATVEDLPSQSISIQVVGAGTPPPSGATPANLQVVASATRLPTDADTAAEGSTITAFVTTAQGTVVSGTSVQFAILSGTSLRSGALQVTRSSTDDSGTAAAVLTTGGNATPGTIRVETRVVTPTGTLIQTIDVQIATAAGTVELFSNTNQLLSNASSTANGVTLTAVVRNAQGQPVAGANVAFSATSGQINGGTTPTDAQGRATAVLTTGGNTSPRSITVLAAATGASSAPLTINVVNAVNSIELLTASNQLSANASTPSQGVALTAIVRDAQGNLLPGVTVAFDGGTGAISATRLVTDASGTATATLTTGGNSTLRTITLLASAAGVTSNTATVTVVGGATTPSGNVTSVQLIGSADTLPVSGGQSVGLTALLRNADGNVVANVPVSFRLIAPNGDGALQVTRGTSDASGTATATLSVGAGTSPRVIDVRADVDTGAGTVASAIFSVNVVAAANGIELFSNSDRLINGQTVGITAVVRNASGAPLAGTTVTFRSTSGALSAGTAVTNASGIATVNLGNGGNNTPRTITVTASAPGASSAPLTINVVNAVSTIELLSAGTQLASSADTASEGLPLTAVVRDSNGNLVAGVSVSFTATNGGVVFGTNLVTGATGTATGNLTVGTTPVGGTIVVTATADGITSNAVSVGVVADVPAPSRTVTELRLIAGRSTLSSDADTAAEGVTITAIAVNASNGTVANVPVTFTLVAPNNAGVLQPGSGTTNAGGAVSTVVTTGGNTAVPRTITVQATVDTGGTPVTQTVSLQVVDRVANIVLLASSSALPSATLDNGTPPVANDPRVLITAIARDVNNNVVVGEPVTFQADSGAIRALQTTTDAAGQATALLSTGGDPRNRTITVTATIGTSTQTVPVDVTGTQLSLSGNPSVGSGVAQQYVASLLDSSGRGIRGQTVTVTSTSGNQLSSASVVTGADGTARFSLTGTVSGADTLTVSALGLSTSLNLVVSTFRVDILSPASGTEVNLGSSVPIQVQLIQNAAPAGAGQTLTFASTRGVIPASAVTNASGIATVNFMAPSGGDAGPAIITVTGPESVTASVALEAVAVAPVVVTVQANPGTIRPNGTATVRAIVKDAAGNLVKNARVNFSLNDASGGSLSTASGFTSSLGVVDITYTASGATSALRGVEITATLPDFGAVPAAIARLTVSQPAISVTLGTDNLISKNTDQTYTKRFVAIFTDTAGNPAPAGTTYRVQVTPLGYQKGTYELADTSVPADGTPDIWVFNPVAASPPTPPQFFAPTTTSFGVDFGALYPGCVHEDVDRDGVLDAGEDYNTNGVLDPVASAVVPVTSPINGNGIANFDLVYPQDYGSWTVVLISLITEVGGTETTTTRVLPLPVLADDLLDVNVAPPGVVSPFGTSTNCANPN